MILFYLKLKIIKKKKVVNYLKKVGIGTKNLPDAIKWHFAFYWKHAISKQQLKNTYVSKKILESYIAVPILLKISVENYKNFN